MTRDITRQWLAGALSVLLICVSHEASALVVLAQYTAGDQSTAPEAVDVGQGLVTTGTSADAFDNIRFTLYSDTGKTPSSAGNAFILTQAYLGAPASLGTAPGLVAESIGIAGGSFVFAPSVTLQGGKQYFIYSDTGVPIGVSTSDQYAGGYAYAVDTPSGNFSEAPLNDINFSLTSGVPPPQPIAQSTSGTLVPTQAFYLGQSVTTTAGGPIDDLSFNFFSDAAASMPTAAGDLYILSKPYAGTPGDLSSGLPDFVAESTGIVDGVYQFAPDAMLAGGTQYFFYTDTPLVFSGSNDNPYPGGQAFTTDPSSGDYSGAALETFDANFVLSGSQALAGQPRSTVSTPETLALLGIGFVCILVARPRRARSRPAPAADRSPEGSSA